MNILLRFILPFIERRLVGTGLQLAIPEGHYGRVAPRSGLAVKHGIDVGSFQMILCI